MITLKIIAFSIALTGYALNNKNTIKESYYCWIISNSLWSIITFYNNDYILSAMFLIYNIFLSYKLNLLINKKQ